MQTYFQLSWPHYGLYKLFPLLIIRFLSLWGQTGVKQQKTLSPDRIEFTLMGKQICSKLYYLSKLSLYTLLLSIFFTIKIAAAANDYGDAPSSYGNPTHTISGNLKLGINAPDAETTAATPLDGSGDDKTATDDEDGVASFPTLSAGGPTGSYVIAKTSLSATGTGTLHAWIDFNQDGAFSASEYASTTVTSSVIAANLTWNNITIPANLRGTTYARLRLTSTTLTDNTSTANVDERATAVASNGEVEDYALTISARDYGDAPATYGDASHQITPNLYLGDNLPDAETASKASFNARTDSYDDGAPSQPVSSYIPLFPVLQLTDTHYSADFKVTNVTGTAARLYGWIDFDKSGTFEADEATVVNVPTGSDKALVTLSWATIPADIKLGTTAIRLRLTSDNTVTLNTPTGNASNGEVEDYPLAIAMDIPPNSQALSIVSGATPMACESVVFQDNFNDLPAGMFWGVYRPNAQPIRNWQRAGGGNDTYAHISGTAQYGNNIYFGNGAVRQITPALNDGFQFDANGKLLTLIDAISLRDEMDDYMSPGTTNLDEYGSQSDWGPEPVQLSRSFATTPGKTYRLYFKAIPERPDSGYYMSGIMRLDLPGGSLHFRAPGSNEGEQSYAVEFTASSTTSTLTFLNYGHIEGAQDGWCDPNVVFNGGPWCTVGGSTSSQPANELLIDEVILTESACSMGTISGTVYIDKNRNNNFDSASENGIAAISVSLYDQNGTTADTSDDRLVATTNTSATGSYSFAYVNASRTYRLQVDTTDPDLPTGAIIGTAMPLMDITVAAGSTTTKQDFGFDLPSGCTTTNTTIYSQNFDSYAMNTWLGQAVTGGSAYYNSTDPTVGGRNGVTQSTWDMQNTSLGASGSGRFLTFWTDNRGPAIPANEHQFYSFQKTVTPNTSYILSFDIGAFNQSPSIQIFINGVSVYGPFAPTSSWKTITIAWDSGSASSIDVDFINNATALNGNDWAIDKISLVRRDTQCVISGKVFEDVNYGGGVGRNANTVGVRPINGARVELYNSNGAFVSNTTTAADGSYSLNTVSTDNYYVRVVNDTVRSNRTGSNGTERGIQTYRTDGITEVINEVGGRKPTSVDTAANTTNQTLNTSTFQLSAGGQAQSVQLIPANNKDTLGVNFGFNFSTVTNTNDSGQGSLRQAIINANLLGNTGLAQPGSTYGVNTGLSKEVLVFNIPAANDPLGRADICGGSTCKITVTSTLPAISAPLIIDGTTQPGYTAGTPGIPHIQLSPVSGLDAIGLNVAYTAADSTVRGLAITGFRTSAMNRAINVEAERVIVEANYIGLTPAGIADANGYGILLEFTQSAIIGGATSAKRNIISGNLHFGIGYDTGASAGLIQNNFIGTNPTGTAALGNQTGGIDLEGANNTQVLDNVISGNAGDGIQIGFTNGTIITSGYTIQGNRIGVGINGEALGNSGPGIMSYGGSKNHQIGGTETGQGNIIAYNLIGGIRLAANNDNTQNIISANSIYANGNLGIDLNANGVTVNDANDADTGANSLLNFPLLSQLGLNNGMLTLSGCAPAGATVELFEADVSNGGKATVGDNKQGKSKDYGEGQTYLTSFVEGSSSDSNSADCTLPTDTDSNNQTGMKAFTVTTPAPATLAVGDLLTLTATLPTVGTSEFSPAFTLNIPTDFSDAPATYGSPSHTIVAGIYLGNTVDSEATPVAPLDGTGDDVIGTDDEDAVTIPIFTQGQGTTISVNVTQTSANSGYLQGWIDFNADGDFADAGEQIALNLQYSTGTSGSISIPTTVPTAATAGRTYARFRWSTSKNLTSTAPASDGEVEDYPVTITTLVTPPTSCSFDGVIWYETPTELRRYHVLTEQDELVTPLNTTYGDIAFGADGNLYAINFTNGYSIHRLNTSTGAATSVLSGTQFSGGNSLSSDELGWLYFGSGDTADTVGNNKIYRFKPGQMSTAVLWLDLSDYGFTGNPSGDFISMNGSMYIAYTPTGDNTVPDKLLRVDHMAADHSITAATTITVVGDIGGSAWGLTANAAGDLFALNSANNTLVRIKLSPFTVTTVGTLGGQPYGATALAEAGGTACSSSVDLSDGPANNSPAPAGSNTTRYGIASHIVTSGIKLGNAIDAELNSIASINADGDGNDDDGVTLPSLSQGQTTTIPVQVNQLSANSGYLQAWIDFNGNGDFADTGEQIALNLQYSAGTSGTISVPLTVPTTATTNPTYARFRWSTMQDLNAMTAAKDGEVEDYALTIHIGRKLTGMVFEDINYGGGAGRSKTAASGVGVNSASVELYTSAGKLFASTTTASDGSYAFSYVPDGNYYVRVVNDTVKSTRSGSNGSERGVQTYRSTGGTVVTTEVGGRKPSTVDAGINNTNQTLNTTTFVLSNGGQAQSVQPISVAGSNLSGIDFGFNFSTVVNTNDSGTGSLRQFLLNANLLGDDSRLAQQGRTLGKENAILMLPVSDPNYRATDNYWSIAIQSALPAITAPLILDGSLQTGSSNNRPQLELQGSNAGAGSHGLTLTATSSGSNLKHLAINRFGGAGIYLNGSSNNTLQANAIGTDPTGKVALANTGSGIKLAVGASNNLIGGATNGTGNQITNNGGAGIAVTDNTSLNNSLLSNSIYANGGLGIDLGEDGVTENDAGDSDTGPNHRLNYPLINSQGIGSNGTQILTYDLSLDVAAGSYRLEFFTNSAQDSSGHGEGQTYLGAKIITHPGTGAVTLKGTLNTSQSVAAGTLVSITTTAINGNSYGSTSEFSTYQSGTNTTVCQDLTTGSGAQTIMLDENSTSLALLKSKDSQGNPINYVISGGLDQNLFILTPAITATPTQDCSQLKFVQSGVVSARQTSVDASKRATKLPPLGNFELPLDSNRDNVYDVQLTATTADGKSYVRTLDFRILNVNEAPTLGVTNTLSVVEESNTKVTTVNGTDPDAGDILTYSITGGDDASQFSIDAVTGQLTFNAIPNFDAPTDTNRDNTYQLEVTATDREGLRVTRPLSVQVTNNTGDDGIALSTRVWLQGPYNQQTQLMDNTLQLKDLLPVKQPYAAQPFAYNGSEVRSSAVNSATAGDALVDWVLIDIRTNANTIVASKAALLQHDGDVVDAQSGSNWLSFANVPTGNYYVSLRHRNHLGVITASPLNLTQTAKLVDFTSTDTVVAGKETRLTNGKSAWLWAGDANASQTLTVSGPANDINTVVARVLNDPSNTQASTNFAAVGYDNADINLDGSSMFTGPSNDANVLLANILLNGLNTNSVTNFIVKGALAP